MAGELERSQPSTPSIEGMIKKWMEQHLENMVMGVVRKRNLHSDAESSEDGGDNNTDGKGEVKDVNSFKENPALIKKARV